MAESLSFRLLADRPTVAPVVAHWYFEQWGRHRGRNEADILEELSAYRNRDRLPLHPCRATWA